MVQLVQLLEQKGLAYQSFKSGSWYFNVGKKNGYGKQLVDLDVSQMKLKTNDDDNNNNDNDNDDDDADEYEPNEKNGLEIFLMESTQERFRSTRRNMGYTHWYRTTRVAFRMFGHGV